MSQLAGVVSKKEEGKERLEHVWFTAKHPPLVPSLSSLDWLLQFPDPTAPLAVSWPGNGFQYWNM